MNMRFKALTPALAFLGAVTLAACSTPKPMEGAGGKPKPQVAGLFVGSRVIGRDAAYVEVTALHRSRLQPAGAHCAGRPGRAGNRRRTTAP